MLCIIDFVFPISGQRFITLALGPGGGLDSFQAHCKTIEFNVLKNKHFIALYLCV